MALEGASGIDGTLSMGMGLSIIMGRMVLVTGDLALLHDTNGWLFSKDKNISLIVIMIDNGGGGIFNQLNIDRIQEGDFEEIFLMPQQVCHLTLAKAYGLKYKQVACLDDLEQAIEWSFSLSTNVLIRVCTNSVEDHKLRVSLCDDLKKHYLRIYQVLTKFNLNNDFKTELLLKISLEEFFQEKLLPHGLLLVNTKIFLL